ncbi:Coiled-coil domain-containing protein 121 [Tupaia chinensis]|uniref:Coiled-coil domain-containing protein 121 n=2 Tax=Tupaia chinensis TaxID=246437 RepID=L8YBC7_TUPCH|nr:Coiled-coil domain-containing protein 121 [Tupaia chinensis]
MAPEAQVSPSTKKSVRLSLRPQRAGSGAAEGRAARAYSATEKVKQLRTGLAATGAECDVRGRWAAPRPVELRTKPLEELCALRPGSRELQTPDTTARSSVVSLGELPSCPDVEVELLEFWNRYTEGRTRSPPPYLSLMNNFFKTEKLTKTGVRLKEKTVQLMKLNQEIKQAQIQQEPLKEDTRQLRKEKSTVQAENKFFLKYLTDKTEEYKRQPEKLWNNYLQKSEEIEQRRQELASRYAKQTSQLKTELLQKEKIQYNLKQQLQALRDISVLKEKQETEIQALQEKKKKVQAETATKKQQAQVQLLQEKALLEKQLSEPNVCQLGKRKGELKKQHHALELAVKQYFFQFYSSIGRDNQELQKELLQLILQSKKLEATQSQLKYQKQLLQQEQWYLDCLSRGRQRLQERNNWCLKE